MEIRTCLLAKAWAAILEDRVLAIGTFSSINQDEKVPRRVFDEQQEVILDTPSHKLNITEPV